MTEPDASAAQRRAGRPDRSSWVAANAGSGKTRVLTNRVARLLLAGTDPQRILCLTYTKAAAGEMQNRLFAMLGRWAMLDDDALARELHDLDPDRSPAGPGDLDRARILFAQALETPGGLKIQTIHAFCEAILRRFPLEAGVVPDFEVLDEAGSRALREDALDAIARRHPDLLAAASMAMRGDDIGPLAAEIARHRHAFAAKYDPAALAARLGVTPRTTEADIVAETILPGDLDMLRDLLPVLRAGSKRDTDAGKKLAAFLAAPDVDPLPVLEDILLTRENDDPAKSFVARTGVFPTKPVREANTALIDRLNPLMTRVEAARRRRLGLAAFTASDALNRFARLWLDETRARKAARGHLDFDDLIDRTGWLLSQSVTTAWVLWRLDGGIDHVLVDEAQDTSPGQWRIVGALTDEFFTEAAGEGAGRTVFVVGDEKQSIYSFQGAAPEAFGEMEAHYAARIGEIGAALEHCALEHSFRSAPPILALVDRVFAGTADLGASADVRHLPFDAAKPGRVDLWPFAVKPVRPEPVPWDAPMDSRAPDDPVLVLAGRIARTLARWLREGEMIPDGDGGWRAMRARDVMILVQRRNPLFHPIIHALKNHGVPVAGPDVSEIGTELAVMDLLAALRVAATPADDLSLAALLRSPLCGVSERALFELAHPRGGRLIDALLACAPAPPWDRPRALMGDLRAQADYLRPFELLQRILVHHDGRRRLVARLGAECEDAIDALLDQALAYESAEPPTLTGFLAFMDRGSATAKRRVDEATDLVRVMTVHAAKGLERPVVLLPHTHAQSEANPPDLVLLPDGYPVHLPKAGNAPPPIAEANAARKAALTAENMRLLYVAMTRAIHWLIVCGAGSAPKPGGDAWYAHIAAALKAMPHDARESADGTTLTLAHNWTPPASASGAAAPGTEPVPLPLWATTPAAPPPPAAPAPLAPSDLGGPHALPGEEGDAREAALERGAIVHSLLETLIPLPPEAREAAAAPLIAGRPDGAELLAEARAVLTAPALAPLFDGRGLPEVEIAAPLGAARLDGRIDLLHVTPERVLAVDFKTNRVVPARPEAIPEGVLLQLGAYAQALAPLWPGREIETAVLWTRTATLMAVPAALSEAALRRAGLHVRRAP